MYPVHTLLALFLLALFLLASFSDVSAQQTPSQISDLNYGTDGTDRLNHVKIVDNKIYGFFTELYGDEGSGLVSTIDPVTGATTAILSPDVSSRIKGVNSRSGNSIYATGEHRLLVQTEPGVVNTLYYLNGDEPVRLLSGPERQFQEFASNGTNLVYFLSAAKTRTADITFLDEQFTELWETDGTPEGTRMLKRLDYQYRAENTRLTVGTRSILIQGYQPDEVRESYYVYDLVSGFGAPLADMGFNVTPYVNVTDTYYRSSTVFHQDSYYFVGRPSGDSTPRIYRLREEPLTLSSFGIPGTEQNPETELREVSLFIVGNELTAALGEIGWSPRVGPFLTRITATEDTVVFSPLENFTLATDVLRDGILRPSVYRDTLYHLSNTAGDVVNIGRYAAGMDSVEVLHQLGDETPTPNSVFIQRITLHHTDSHLFVASSGRKVIYRFNRSDYSTFDTITLTDNAARPGTFVYNGAIGGDFYYTFLPNDQNQPGAEVYRWPAGSNSPVLVRAGGTLARPEIVAAHSTKGRLLIEADSVSLFGEQQLINPSPFQTDADLYFYEYHYYDSLYAVAYDRTTERTSYFVSKNGEATHPVVTGLSAANEAGYRVWTWHRYLSNATQELRPIYLPEQESWTLSRMTFSNDTVNIEPLGNEFNRTLSSIARNEGRYAYGIQNPDSTMTLVALTLAQEDLVVGQATVPLNLEAAIRASTNAGFYLEQLSPDGRSELLYVPYGNGPAARVIPLPDDVSRPANVRFQFYPIGDRLIFEGLSDSLGQEWYYAEPGAQEAKILRDVHAGPESGVYSRNHWPLGDYLFFLGNDGQTGQELWVTDGTEAGTRLVSDLHPGPNGSFPDHLVLQDSMVYFTANGPAGYELYRMPLETLEPELVVDLNPDGDGLPYDLHVIGDHLYFMGRLGPGNTFELFTFVDKTVPTSAPLTRAPATVFPNPVRNGGLTVRPPQGETLLRTEVFNQRGQLLVSGGRATRIDLSNLPAGTYWLRSWYESGRFSINAVQRAR